MAISGILASIDFDIAKLQQARALLAGDTVKASKRAVGRPKKAASVASVATKPTKKNKCEQDFECPILESLFDSKVGDNKGSYRP